MKGTVNAILVVIVGGGLDAIASEIIDPDGFNFVAGLRHLGAIAMAGGLISLGAWFVGRMKRQ